MKMKTINLSPQDITRLIENFGSLKFANEFDLVYESQIPPAAFVFLEGKLDFVKRNKSQSSAVPGTLIGAYQLIHDQPVKFGARVRSNSELIVIHKSAILEAAREKDSELYQIIREIFEPVKTRSSG